MDAPKLIVLIPVFNDWVAVSLLLATLDVELRRSGLTAEVCLIDDGSTVAHSSISFPDEFSALQHIEILALRRNLGHQRAIAVGLAYVEMKKQCHVVVVMDGDGEDQPSDVPRLVQECQANGNGKIVFAERTRRSEHLMFRFFYRSYRFFHRLLTGYKVKVGNFSAIPAAMLQNLVVVSELWNHYAAAVYRSRIPFTLLPTCRGKRLHGEPRMNMISLVSHGLSAMAVFGDRIGVRLMMVWTVATLFVFGALGVVVGIRLLTDLAIPGWATYASGLLFVMLTQMGLAAFVFVFMILSARDTASFLPCRDCQHFIGGVHEVYRRD